MSTIGLRTSGSDRDPIWPLGLTVTEVAARLGVTRQNLNNLLNGKSGISPEMAIRLSKAFGSRAEVWLGLQMDYDLAEAEKTASKIRVTRITPKKETVVVA
ncbi:MAG: HigA family addiction module antidote protein [Nitrospira sp.]|nr:HigA family addiction module antidote protein [Nitrospira sp.]